MPSQFMYEVRQYAEINITGCASLLQVHQQVPSWNTPMGDAGYVSRKLVEDHTLNGWIRPSFIHQPDAKQDPYKRLPRLIRDLDKTFTPPYDQCTSHPVSTANTLSRRRLIKLRKWVRR